MGFLGGYYFISERYCENPECDCKRLLADIIAVSADRNEMKPIGEVLVLAGA